MSKRCAVFFLLILRFEDMSRPNTKSIFSSSLVFLLVCLLSHWSVGAYAAQTIHIRMDWKWKTTTHTHIHLHSHSLTRNAAFFGIICFMLAALRYMRQHPRISKYTERTRQMETHRKRMKSNEKRTNKKKEHGGNATSCDSSSDVFYLCNVIGRINSNVSFEGHWERFSIPLCTGEQIRRFYCETKLIHRNIF